MALKKVGVEFVAQNAEAYFAAMAKGVTATGQMGSATQIAAEQSGKLDAAQLRLASQITRTTDTLALQKRQYALLEQSLAETTAKYGEGSLQAQKQQLALDKLSSSITNNERSLAVLHKELAEGSSTGIKWGEVLTGALRRVGEMATNLAMDAGRQLISFLKNSVTAAGDFEAGLQRFGAVTGLASSQLGQFNDLFLQLGKDTQYSAAQAEEAAINLAKGGIEPATIAAGALRDTLALAAAGELELGTAAEVTAKQLGVWSDQGVTAADVANRMSQAANASTVGVQDLALGMANVGDVAKIAGLSFKETVQTMAMVAPGFSSAADAGTSFKTFLTNLTPTSKSAIDAFKELGLITADGTNKFYDASGAFVGMQQAAQLLQGATENLTDAQKKQLLATAFGTDAVRIAARVAENGASGFLAMGQSMDKAGNATDQAAKRQQGYNYAMEQLKGSLETLQITLGQKLLPVITDFVQGLTKMTNGLMGVTEAVSGLLGMNELEQSTEGVMIGFKGTTKEIQRLQQITPLLTRDIEQLRDRAPEASNAINSMAHNLDTLYVAGGGWAKQAEIIYAQFRQTGNVDAFTAAITRLTQEYQTAQTVAGTAGGGFRATLQQLGLDANATSGDMAGLADAAMRYANIAPVATTATQALGSALSEAAKADLQKELDAIDKKGEKAFADVLASQVNYQIQSQNAQAEHDAAMKLLQEQYNSATTEAERQRIQQMMTDEQTGFATQATQRAAAYGQERMEQQAHLGEMLIEHMIVWGKMRGVSQERINEITGQIATQYGVAKDSVSLSFADMTTKAEAWALGTETSSKTAVSGMLDAQNAASIAQARYAEIAGKLKADLDAQLAANKLNIQQYNAALASIPAKVSTILEVDERIQRNYDAGMADAAAQHGAPQAGQGRAYGGRVAAGNAYTVGEGGRPELFVPDRSGYILPPSAAPTMTTYNTQTSYAPTYTYAPTYGGTPPSPAYDFLMMEARAQ